MALILSYRAKMCHKMVNCVSANISVNISVNKTDFMSQVSSRFFGSSEPSEDKKGFKR